MHTLFHFCIPITDKYSIVSAVMKCSTSLNSLLTSMIDGCTECGGCVRQCAFLRCYGNPLQLATKYKESALTPEVVYSCSLCRLCDVHCPEALEISGMLWRMRRDLVDQGKGPLKHHRRILAYEKWGLSRLLRASVIPEDADTIFYPGCAMAGTRTKQTQRLYELLKKTIPTLPAA